MAEPPWTNSPLLKPEYQHVDTYPEPYMFVDYDYENHYNKRWEKVKQRKVPKSLKLLQEQICSLVEAYNKKHKNKFSIFVCESEGAPNNSLVAFLTEEYANKYLQGKADTIDPEFYKKEVILL